ncbi:unnamed protein product, partial [Owenia fusiformis]
MFLPRSMRKEFKVHSFPLFSSNLLPNHAAVGDIGDHNHIMYHDLEGDRDHISDHDHIIYHDFEGDRDHISDHNHIMYHDFEGDHDHISDHGLIGDHDHI